MAHYSTATYSSTREHFSAYHIMMEIGSCVLEVRRPPDSRSPLLGVVVKLLAPKRSSLHDAPRQPFAPNFQSPQVAMMSWPLILPRVSVALSRPRRRDFILARHRNRPYSKEPANHRKNAAALLQLPQPVKPRHKPTRATIPKTGRRGGDLENRLDERSCFARISCQRPSGSME